MKKLLLLTTVVMSFFMQSCLRNEYDFDNGELDPDYHPNVAAPLVKVKANFGTILDSLRNNENIYLDDDSLIWVRYEDELLSFTAGELINFEDQAVSDSFRIDPLELNDIDAGETEIYLSRLSDEMDASTRDDFLDADGDQMVVPTLTDLSIPNYPLEATDVFEWFIVDQGTLRLTFTNGWPFPVENLIIDIKNDNQYQKLVKRVEIPLILPGDSVIEEVPLVNDTLENILVADIVRIESSGTNNLVDIEMTDPFVIRTEMNGLTVTRGKARLPKYKGEVFIDSVDVKWEMNNEEELSFVKMAGCDLSYEVDYKFPEPARVYFQIPGLTKDGEPFEDEIVVSDDQLVQGTYDLSGYSVEFAQLNNTFRAHFWARLESSEEVIEFNIYDDLDVSLKLTGIEIAEARGYIGQQELDFTLEGEEFDFFTSVIDAELELVDPRVNLDIRNSIGVPLSLDLSGLKVTTADQELILTGTDVTWTNREVNSPNVFGDTAATRIEINKETSNIVEAIKIRPNGIKGDVEAVSNPQGKTGIDNFIAPEQGIAVNMEVDIPLHAGIAGYKLRDVQKLDKAVFDGIKRAELRYRVDNGFPTDINVQIYFANADTIAVDSLFTGAGKLIVQAAEVDASGEVTAATKYEDQILFGEDLLESISEYAEYIIVESTLSTPENGEVAVKFKTNYEINIDVGMIATIKLGDKED